MKTVKDSTGKEYLKSEKTELCYNIETPIKVIEAIEKAFINRTRVTLDYGHKDTGKSWGEVFDITGRIGRSTGTIKIPLLVYNTRSMGGGALLSHCIVKMSTSAGNNTLYQHPNYQPFKQEVK